MGYLRSVAELKDVSQIPSNSQTMMNGASLNSTKSTYIIESKMQYPQETSKDNYDLPRMPPWLADVCSQKLYQSLAGSLRLVGLSFMTGHFNTRVHFLNLIHLMCSVLTSVISCCLC